MLSLSSFLPGVSLDRPRLLRPPPLVRYILIMSSQSSNKRNKGKDASLKKKIYFTELGKKLSKALAKGPDTLRSILSQCSGPTRASDKTCLIVDLLPTEKKLDNAALAKHIPLRGDLKNLKPVIKILGATVNRTVHVIVPNVAVAALVGSLRYSNCIEKPNCPFSASQDSYTLNVEMVTNSPISDQQNNLSITDSWTRSQSTLQTQVESITGASSVLYTSTRAANAKEISSLNNQLSTNYPSDVLWPITTISVRSPSHIRKLLPIGDDLKLRIPNLKASFFFRPAANLTFCSLCGEVHAFEECTNTKCIIRVLWEKPERLTFCLENKVTDSVLYHDNNEVWSILSFPPDCDVGMKIAPMVAEGLIRDLYLESEGFTTSMQPVR